MHRKKKRFFTKISLLQEFKGSLFQTHPGLFLLLHLGVWDLQPGTTTAPRHFGPLCPVKLKQITGSAVKPRALSLQWHRYLGTLVPETCAYQICKSVTSHSQLWDTSAHHQWAWTSLSNQTVMFCTEGVVQCFTFVSCFVSIVLWSWLFSKYSILFVQTRCNTLS